MQKLFFLLFIGFVCLVQAETKKKIFILHSYSQEYGWTKLQHEGFVSAIKGISSTEHQIVVEYLDTKRLKFSDGYQRFFLEYLQKKYSGFKPDAIYVTDDNALKFFLNHHTSLFSSTPVFFSGVNDLSLINNLDRDRYTGVFETKEIIPNIELIRQFSPQTREIWIIGDGSDTYKAIESDVKRHISKYTKYKFHFIASPKIEEVMKALPTAPKSFVVLTTIGGWSDSNGSTLSLQESIAQLKEKSNLILCSMEDAYMIGGVVGGLVTSGMRQGSSAAELMNRYLNGNLLNNISPITQSPNVYMFDRRALMNSRLILSEYIARQSVIVHEEKTFLEIYQEEILNALFLLFILFFVFLVVTFFISLQKSKELKEVKQSLNNALLEIESIKEGSKHDA